MTRWLILTALVLAVILVPFALFGDTIEGWSTTTLADLRDRPLLAASLIVGLLAGDAVLPVPSSVVSTASGALFGWAVGAGVIWFGMMLGAGIAYALGAAVARGAGPRWFDARELARARASFASIGPAALILTRAVPVLSEAAALAAGGAQMPRGRFIVAVAVANAVVAIAYGALGAAAVSTGSFLVAFTGLAAVPALAWGIWRMSRT